MNKAVFLDRDGVINRKPPEGEYVTRWQNMHFLPGVAKCIALFKKAGFLVIVVSNQRCVAKKLLTAQALDSMHHRMCQRFAAAGAKIDAVYYCPHEQQPACACRKPAPGMLLAAAREHQVDLALSWMIGDSDSDVEAGREAGCRAVRLLHGKEKVAGGYADVVAKTLLEATCQILQREEVIVQVPRQPWPEGKGATGIAERSGD